MVPRKSTYKRTCSQLSHMLPGSSFSLFQGVQQDQERNAEVLHVEVARVERPDGAAVHVPREAGAVPSLLLVASGRAGSPPALTHPTQARSRRGSSPSAVQSPPGSSAELFVAEHPNQPGQAETIAPASFAYGASATLLGA